MLFGWDAIGADVVPNVVKAASCEHCFIESEIRSLGDQTPDLVVTNDVPMLAKRDQPFCNHAVVTYAISFEPRDDFLSRHADNVVEVHSYLEEYL